MNTDTAAMHWLNARSWLIYSLCDGRDVGSVRDEYGRRAGLDSESARTQVDACLSELTAAGLVR